MQEYVIGGLDEIPDNGAVAVRAGNQVVAVFRSGQRLYAVHNTCPHKGGQLCQGDFEPETATVRCPLHLWVWRLDTGELEADPRQQIRTYPVKLVDGQVVLSA